MLKLLGCVLLTLGGWGLGAYLTTRDKRKITHGEDLVDLVRFIRVQIATFCRPREEVFRLYRNERLEENGFLSRLVSCGSIAVALRDMRDFADPAVLEWMTAFDHTLGRGYCEGEVAACDYYITRMEAHLAKRRQEHPARARIWRTVTMAGALMAALLLL